MPSPTKRRHPRGACHPPPRVAGGRLPHKDEIRSALKGSPDVFCLRTNQEEAAIAAQRQKIRRNTRHCFEVSC
jgi:hypothetical protein